MEPYMFVTSFFVAFVAGLAAQPLHIYDVHARGIGIGKASPWRRTADAGVAKVRSALANAMSWISRHRWAFACLLLVCLSLWDTATAEAHDGMRFAAPVVLAALEDQLAEKAKAAKELFDTQAKTCEAENRVRTDDEKAAVQKILEEAKGIKSQIDRAKGDQAMNAEIERMLGEQAKNRTSAIDAFNANRKPKSLGAQFVGSSEYEAFRKQGRAKGARWSTGVVELHSELLDSDAGSPGSGGDLIVPDYRPGILPLLFRRLTIADLIAPGSTESNLIVYMKETTFTNNADTVAEAATKPESGLRFDQEEDRVHKIAHWLPVTEEMLEDVPQLRSYIDARLRLGVQLAEEDKLLNGADSPAELTGILNRDGLRTAEAAGGSPDDPNADAIFRQMMGIFNDSFIMPDGIVINPLNWQTIQLMKDTSGAYMGGGPFQVAPAPRLWGLPVVATPAISEGMALVGAFRQAAQVFRKGGIRVEASNSHDDYFIRNLVAIRAEERLALAVYRPGAFGTVTGLD
jgi:HK97 family phage major capsid protein